MNKSEREELRRLLRSRFKVLKADVLAREAELKAALEQEVAAKFAAMDKQYDDAMYRVRLATVEATRVANDCGRELWGADAWGVKSDRPIVSFSKIDHPGTRLRRQAMYAGHTEITRRVQAAMRELERQENELLTDLATSALESAEAKAFFARIPSVSELVPAYRMAEIEGARARFQN